MFEKVIQVIRDDVVAAVVMTLMDGYFTENKVTTFKRKIQILVVGKNKINRDNNKNNDIKRCGIKDKWNK